MRFTLIFGTEHARPIFRKKKFGFQVPVYPPLGVLYLGSALEDAGHEVEIIDFFIDRDPSLAIDKSIHHSDAIGLSVDNISFSESAQIAQYIKNKDPHLPVIIGGPHCTLYQEQSLVDISSADISVNGDGEQAIVDIAKAFEGTVDKKAQLITKSDYFLCLFYIVVFTEVLYLPPADAPIIVDIAIIMGAGIISIVNALLKTCLLNFTTSSKKAINP